MTTTARQINLLTTDIVLTLHSTDNVDGMTTMPQRFLMVQAEERKPTVNQLTNHPATPAEWRYFKTNIILTDTNTTSLTILFLGNETNTL